MADGGAACMGHSGGGVRQPLAPRNDGFTWPDLFLGCIYAEMLNITI